MTDQNLNIIIENINKLERDYIGFCRKNKLGDNAVDAFDKWISAVVNLLRKYYPASHPDYIKIRDLNTLVDGDELCKLYGWVNKTIHTMLDEIANDEISPLKSSRVSNGTKSRGKKPLVFICHSALQKPLVTALVELLEHFNFTSENLFCSSVPGFDIGLNDDIVETLKKKFLEYNLFVIFVLSSDFFKSAWCMNEAGAAWVIQADYAIIETKDLDEKAIDGVIPKTNIRVSFKSSGEELKKRMKEMRDKLIAFAGREKVAEEVWEQYYNEFIENLSANQGATTESSSLTNSSSSFLVTGGPDTIVRDAVNKLGEFTIKELQEETGINEYRFLAKKINAMVLSGDLDAVGPNTHRKYRVNTSSHTLKIV